MENLNVTMSDDVKNVLKRMNELQIIFNSDKFDEIEENKYHEEYKDLQSKMVPIFMPIIESMIKSGLITTTIELDEDEDEDINNYEHLSAYPICAFENGNIWISGIHSGGILR